MKLGIMQPYFFPYLGYWQLINAVDRFVILDDVNYIMRGYINRNSILVNGKPYRFTIPIKKASQNKLIMDTKLNFDEKEKKKFLTTILNAYKRAPNYLSVMPLLEDVIFNADDDLTKYIQHSLEVVCNYLEINTQIYVSSKIEKDNTLRAQERIIDICKKLGADTYYNAIGGQKLYDNSHFSAQGIELHFLKTKEISYKQIGNEYVPNLSIIDIIMNNGKEKIKEMLLEYELL